MSIGWITKIACVGLVCASVLVAAGCRPKPPTTVPVRGRITYQGGAWPTPGTIVFAIVEPAAGFPGRPGAAEFDTDGRFVVKSWQNREGLLPGRYRLAVECWKAPPVMEGPPPVSYVPKRYQDPATSELELLILPHDPPRNLDLDIPAEAP